MTLNGKQIRCAIYTRKSTEEGLEQAFNSLDAQREACEAYIASQCHEGWVLTPGNYDDGGFSGGNMDRPALKKLLGEVKDGKVDVIVVYKVDRLTRNLGDFAKIVDVLDAASASFVSVTQAFNTTTSMGRLTLNVLLSFAQFEREVTGERIRDKIAASKAKGMWMGGVVPLGYDVVERKLVVNATEAEQVRQIFSCYLDVKSVRSLKQELDVKAITSKVRTSTAGNISGGVSMSRGALYQLLQNQLYIGKVTHKGNVYDGEHAAILNTDLFDAAQSLLAENRAGSSRQSKAVEPSVLAGKLWDAEGRRMSPSHTTRRGKRYRYYISRQDVPSAVPQYRLAAGDIETLVSQKLVEWLQNEASIYDLVAPLDPTTQQAHATLAKAKTLAGEIASSSARNAFAQLVAQVEISDDLVVVHVNAHSLIPTELTAGSKVKPATVELTVPTQFTRVGAEMKLIVGGRSAQPTPDPALVKLVVKSFAARRAVEQSPEATVAELAKNHGVGREYFGVLLRLSYLAPDIQAAILAGQQPVPLTRQRLARLKQLPHDWSEQRNVCGMRPFNWSA